MSASRGLVATLLTSFTLLILSVLTGALVARLLLPEGRGVLAEILLWPQVLGGIMLFSLGESITFHASKKTYALTDIFSSGLLVALLLSAVAIAIGLLILPMLLYGANSSVSLAKWYLIIYIPHAYISYVLLGLDQGEKKFLRYNLMRLMPQFVYLTLLCVALIWGGISIFRVALSGIAGTSILVIFRLWQLRQWLTVKVDLKVTKSLLATGIKFHALSVVFLLTMFADQILVISSLSSYHVGIYMVAATIAGSGLAVIANSVQQVLFPSIAGVESSKQIELLARGLRLTTFSLCAIALVVIVSVPVVIPALFGDSYRASIELSQLLAIANVSVLLRQTAVRSLRGMGESRLATITESLGLAVYFVLGWWLAHKYELIGIAGAIFLSGTISYGYLLWKVRNKFDLCWKDLLGLDVLTAKELFVYIKQTVMSKRN